MRKKLYKNTSNLARIRSFRFTLDEDMRLRVLAAVLDINASSVLRLALNEYWDKHSRRLTDVDPAEIREEIDRTLRKYV